MRFFVPPDPKRFWTKIPSETLRAALKYASEYDPLTIEVSLHGCFLIKIRDTQLWDEDRCYDVVIESSISSFENWRIDPPVNQWSECLINQRSLPIEVRFNETTLPTSLDVVRHMPIGKGFQFCRHDDEEDIDPCFIRQFDRIVDDPDNDDVLYVSFIWRGRSLKTDEKRLESLEQAMNEVRRKTIFPAEAIIDLVAFMGLREISRLARTCKAFYDLLTVTNLRHFDYNLSSGFKGLEPSVWGLYKGLHGHPSKLVGTYVWNWMSMSTFPSRQAMIDTDMLIAGRVRLKTPETFSVVNTFRICDLQVWLMAGLDRTRTSSIVWIVSPELACCPRECPTPLKIKMLHNVDVAIQSEGRCCLIHFNELPQKLSFSP